MRKIILFLIASILFISGCTETPALKLDGEDCHEHSECKSGVCNYYKMQNGKCAPVICGPGNKTHHNDFFCNENKKWEASKEAGSSCKYDYECYQENCYESPICIIT